MTSDFAWFEHFAFLSFQLLTPTLLRLRILTRKPKTTRATESPFTSLVLPPPPLRTLPGKAETPKII